MMRIVLYAGLILSVFLSSAGCGRKDEPARVSLEKKEEVDKQAASDGKGSLRIAVGGMITPKEGFAYYRKFLDYVGEKTGRHVEFVDREDYAEINKLVGSGKVDVAFVCGGPYVDGHKEFGMELLVAPQAYGGSVYYSYIIVAKDSAIDRFEGLRGKTFAFTDPLSNTGKLVPTYMLARMDETPADFFKKYIYTKSHDKAIRAVAQGIVEGAAVDSLIWEYTNRVSPEITSKTRVIKKSPPYGIPPVVVPKDLAPETKTLLRQVFLNAHNDEKGREILKGMMIERFVDIDDSAYNSIREMKTWLERRRGKRD
ncbi:MAG: phosphate/phosphite/phosphonate ABC transporter substrate-binding protein [Nitrospirae bacterium]|nr:phosphate/phosphite/phosphonate ABC transporter substrate-binding protein [Nitrospirota bacterium]